MAPNSPARCFIHASMAGSRSTAPLNRSKSVLIIAPLSVFEIYGSYGRFARHSEATAGNVTKSPDVCPRLFRGRVARDLRRAIHTAAPRWDRRAWRGARAGKQQSNRPRSLLKRQRQSEEGPRLAGRGSGWRLRVFPRTQGVLR